MGFSLTGSQVIFFVASVIVAGSVSGVFMSVSLNASDSMTNRGNNLVEKLDTEFKIINDNGNIFNLNSNYHFYLKNIGIGSLITSNETFNIFIDGEVLPIVDYNFSDSSIWSGEITTMYVNETKISAGDHTLRVVGPQAVEDKFEFNN